MPCPYKKPTLDNGPAINEDFTIDVRFSIRFAKIMMPILKKKIIAKVVSANDDGLVKPAFAKEVKRRMN